MDSIRAKPAQAETLQVKLVSTVCQLFVEKLEVNHQGASRSPDQSNSKHCEFWRARCLSYKYIFILKKKSKKKIIKKHA